MRIGMSPPSSGRRIPVRRHWSGKGSARYEAVSTQTSARRHFSQCIYFYAFCSSGFALLQSIPVQLRQEQHIAVAADRCFYDRCPAEYPFFDLLHYSSCQ
jgi:hypothetical protein